MKRDVIPQRNDISFHVLINHVIQFDNYVT